MHVALVQSRSKTLPFIFSLALAAALPTASLAQTFAPVSVGPGGVSGNGPSSNPSITPDARFVAFTSSADNLVASDTNASADVFVRDRLAGVTSRVSVTSAGQERAGASDFGQISPSGRFVVFVSTAALVTEDTHSACSLVTEPCADIYVRDRDTGTTTRVSVSSAGLQADGASYGPSISADGRYVVFTSAATNLVANDTNGQPDSFLHDRVSGVTTRVTAAHDTGLQLAHGGNSARISSDGATIIYTGVVPTSAPPYPQGCPALTCGVTYYLNRETGERAELTTIWVNAPDSGLPNRMQRDNVIALSGDGRVMVIEQTSITAFASTFVQYWTVDRTTRRATVSALVNGTDTDAQVRGLSGNGRLLGIANKNSQIALFRLTDRVTGIDGVVGPNGQFGALATGMALDDAGYTVAFASLKDFNGTSPQGGIWLYDRDTDDDLMPDEWETLFGFDINGPGDAGLDSDSDGLSNLQEFQRGSHPKATAANTRYFAEGAANTFFTTRFATLNPNPTPALVVYRFLGTHGETSSSTRTLPASSRTTFDMVRVGFAPENDFSTVVESDQPIVIDRTMTWDAAGNGSHAETSIAAPSMTWHLAEGATHGAFDLFYLIQNPGDTLATVQITYMRLAPNAPVVRSYDVEPHSRRTIWVDQEGPELAETDVAASITSTQPIIVERAMYASAPGEPFRAGHGGAAVPAPATRWYLAEGATGNFFDMYVLISNPGTTAADVRLTYLLPTGETFSADRTVGPQNRLTLTVADQDPRLANTPVSVIVESTNAQPVVVERSMWWPKGQWYEAHLVAGATQTGTRWALAEGQVGWDISISRPVDTYILIANTSATAGSATVTLFLEGGGQLQYQVPLPANSRVNFPTTGLFDPTANWRFGAIVESNGVPIVVERAMYSTVNGLTWSAGTASLGTRLQ
jgi:hypothetical protein